MNDRYASLCERLAARPGTLFVALSGGIDSLTLMTIAARVRSAPTIATHAVSAAVPPEATARCRALAQRFAWPLRELDAQEFADADYVSNPHNRCYHCKSRLFVAIQACSAEIGRATIATGTNTEDLSDFRPGLKAAAERQVWQPYVEAGISKTDIRAMARHEGLGELANLPAAPCLSSRIETGIPINADDLRLVHRVERLITERSVPGDIRCRVSTEGVTVQLPKDNPLFFNESHQHEAADAITAICQRHGKRFKGFQPYEKGSAFIKPVVVSRAGS